MAEDCPSEDQLARFLEGGLDGELFARTERHLSRCPMCMALVAEAGHDVVGHATRSATAPDNDLLADPPALGPGVEVGRYVIVEPIGVGGMGRVYAAQDPALDRKVALKVLHPHAAGPELEARLLREAKAMASLVHPGVITIYDVGRFGDQLFIAMELVEGGTLREWLCAERRSWREILDVFVRAGRGLARAHAGGIVHRDFKPDNVLVGLDGRVRVTDFGLALTARPDSGASSERAAMARSAEIDAGAPLTRTGVFVGTPAYMAPEQLTGAAADARSDLYGFSVALWEALYGERPHHGRTVAELQRDKLSGSVRPPPHPRGVPAWLNRVLRVGLRSDPADRYPSMDVMLGALERSSRTSRLTLAGRLGAVAALLALGVATVFVGRAKGHSVGAAVATPPNDCTASACSAAHGGKPFVCGPHGGGCMPLESDDCRVLAEAGDAGNDETLWIGALYRDPYAGGAVSRVRAMDLARREMARAGGLPPRTGSTRRRPVGLVLCATARDEVGAARHLAESGVPAVVGFVRDIQTIATVLLPAKMMFVSLSNDDRLTRLQPAGERPRLVWRATDSAGDRGAAAAAIALQASDDASDPETRVLLVRLRDETSLQAADAFLSALKIGGRSVAEMHEAVLEIDHDVGEDLTASDGEKIARFSPTVVVSMGSEPRWLPEIEAMSSKRRPLVVATTGDWSAPSLAIADKDERARRRFFAVDDLADTESNVKFAMRFNDAFGPETTVTPSEAPSVPYDPIYLIALAAVAASDHPVSGETLAEGVGSLVPDGPKLEVGPAHLFEAFDRLRGGGHIDLEGAGSPLDFDTGTGESHPQLAIYCLKRRAHGRRLERVRGRLLSGDPVPRRDMAVPLRVAPSACGHGIPVSSRSP